MKAKLLKIISFYGVNHQQRKLQEEVFELNEAIINAENNRLVGISRNPSELAIKHIAEEIADVEVMLLQFKEYYHIDGNDILKIMNEKIDRQLERIEKEKVEKNIIEKINIGKKKPVHRIKKIERKINELIDKINETEQKG